MVYLLYIKITRDLKIVTCHFLVTLLCMWSLHCCLMCRSNEVKHNLLVVTLMLCSHLIECELGMLPKVLEKLHLYRMAFFCLKSHVVTSLKSVEQRSTHLLENCTYYGGFLCFEEPRGHVRRALSFKTNLHTWKTVLITVDSWMERPRVHVRRAWSRKTNWR